MGIANTKSMSCNVKLESILGYATEIKEYIDQSDESGVFNKEYITMYTIPKIRELGGEQISPEGKTLLDRLAELIENFSDENIKELKDVSKRIYNMILSSCKDHKCQFCQQKEFKKI